MKETCICIAGDVKGSRHLNHERLVTSLEECAASLNRGFPNDLLIPFKVRNGDEIVGVLEHFSSGYLAARRMMETLHEKEIYLYLGLGLGKLESADATVHTMNGTAVLNAFEARDHFLKGQHSEANQWQIAKKETAVFFYTEDYPYQALNALVYTILEKIYSRSDKQKHAIQLIRQNPSLNYEQVGKQLGYESPKSTVSYLLSRANYHVVNAMEDSLQQLLDDLQKWFNYTQQDSC
ncbi:MAG TPA: hypothetical protein VF149_01450 [Bacillales bacterium]